MTVMQGSRAVRQRVVGAVGAVLVLAVLTSCAGSDDSRSSVVPDASAPDGWKTIEYRGVQVDIPTGWTRSDVENCEFPFERWTPPSQPACFTTSPRPAARRATAPTSPRCSRCPIFHVNGEDPEAVRAGRRARDRLPPARSSRDVVIDMYCYRSYGHNEGDEPRFTQPVMYEQIDEKPTRREVYVERLVERGRRHRRPKIAAIVAEAARQTRGRAAQAASRKQRRAERHVVRRVEAATRRHRRVDARGRRPASPRERLATIAESDHRRCPPASSLHPKSSACCDSAREMARGERPLDWGMGEPLAFGIAALRRASRCASQRPGLAPRHVQPPPRRARRLQRPATSYTPLAHLAPRAGAVSRSTTARCPRRRVLGFEFGYSLDYARRARRSGRRSSATS